MNATRLSWVMGEPRNAGRKRRGLIRRRSRAGSDHFQIDGLGTLRVGLCVKRNTLALRQSAHAGGLDAGGVHKHILAAAFGGHKAKALIRIEEFHCSDCHGHSDT